MISLIVKSQVHLRFFYKEVSQHDFTYHSVVIVTKLCTLYPHRKEYPLLSAFNLNKGYKMEGLESEIIPFYKNKTIFLTGGSGFVGRGKDNVTTKAIGAFFYKNTYDVQYIQMYIY